MTKELTNYSSQPPARAPMNPMGSVESSRAIAEVQGQVLMAKQFPRDQIQARADILEACKRMRLAETALYSYPRGGTRVEGPSVRLAEMLAQYWGNIDYGIIELEQKAGVQGKAGESVMMAYCRDIQTNTRRQIVFTVPHIRSKKSGNVNLNDPRDIYELVANMGSRRLRACILGIIPGDIIEEAVEAVNRTLAGNSDKPLIDRIKDMVEAFKKIGVSQAMLEKRLGQKVDACLPLDVIQLGKIFKSIQDGMSKVEDWFESKAQPSAPPASPPTPDPAPKKETEKPAEEEPPPGVVPECETLREMKDSAEWIPVIERLQKNKTLGPATILEALRDNDGYKCQTIIELLENNK